MQTAMADTLPFWKDLNSAQKERFLENASHQSYKKDQLLLSSDAQCLGMILVTSGSLRVYLLSEEGREITLYRINAGEFCVLSASCVLNSITFDVYVDAVMDSEVLQISSSILNTVIHENIYAECCLYKMATERFSDVMWAMQQILFMSFDKRLANFLMEQIAIEDSLTLHITQEKIASHLGSAREVVTRMLKYFQQEGVVRLFRGGIKVIDEEQLYRMTDPNSYRHRPS